MMVLVSYDVGMDSKDGASRLRRIANCCKDYGVRVQYSIFECDVMPDQWVEMQNKLLSIYDPEVDSLRFYKLGKNWRHKVEHHGAKSALDIFGDTLII